MFWALEKEHGIIDFKANKETIAFALSNDFTDKKRHEYLCVQIFFLLV